MEIEGFVKKLADYTNFDNSKVMNQYHKSCEYSKQTCTNLYLYLKNISKLKPTILLVGEAPGYKGCKKSGIPFTSERILKENPFFGLENGYIIRKEKKPESESTATKIWQELNNIKHQFLPLFWNSFPFHPYQVDIKTKKEKNRHPSEYEIETIGIPFLNDLIPKEIHRLSLWCGEAFYTDSN